MCPPIFWRTAGAWHSPAKWSLFTPSFQLQTRGMPLNLDHKEIFGLCFYLPLRSILSNKISRMLLIWSRDSHMLLLWSRDCHLFIIFLWKKKKKTCLLISLATAHSLYSADIQMSVQPSYLSTFLVLFWSACDSLFANVGFVDQEFRWFLLTFCLLALISIAFVIDQFTHLNFCTSLS